MSEIDKLIHLSRKLGKCIGDEGTYEEQQSKYLVMKWKFKGQTFAHKFPGSMNTTTLNYQFYQMRKNLRASGLGPPWEIDIECSKKQQEILEEIWKHLGTDDEGGTPYGGDLDKN